MASSSAQSGQAEGKVGGVDTALADELVLEIVDDVAAFAVELDDAAALGDGLHNLADEVVGAHADLVLLVGHEHLEGGDAHFQGLGEALEDVGAVVEDVVEGEVDHGGGLDFLAVAVDGGGEGLFGLNVVGAEGQEGGEAGMGGGDGAELVGVAAVEVDVTVDEAREDELAGGVDIAVGGREKVIWANGDYLLV